ERDRRIRELRGGIEDRVAVRRALRDVVGSDRRIRARAWIDDDLLLPALGQMRQQHARGKVVASAEGERDYDAHGLRGKVLREGGAEGKRQGRSEKGAPESGEHADLLL